MRAEDAKRKIADRQSTPARRTWQAAATTRWATTLSEVRRQALDLIIDTFAVMAAGAAHPSLRPVASSSKQAGLHGRRLSAGASLSNAALLNGATTTVLQLQDGHRIARGHPMSHVLPAAFAVAEELDATPEEFMSSVVAGYEVSARVGRALGGLQDLSTTLELSAPSAPLFDGVSRVGGRRGCDAQAIEGSAAVALFPYRATPMAGATVHHLYVGLGASTGVIAGKAAVFGLSSLAGTLESFFGPRAGADFQVARLTEGIGSDGRWESYECLQAYLKLHPTCAHLNGINDAALALLQRGRVEAAQIERIDVESYGTALDYNIAEPSNDLSARFSIPFAVAIAFHTGPLGPKSITDIALAKPAIRDLAKRVHVRHEPELDRGYPAGRPARLAVTMTDGRIHRAEASIPRGDVANPLSPAERKAKARTLLEIGFGPIGASRSWPQSRPWI